MAADSDTRRTPLADPRLAWQPTPSLARATMLSTVAVAAAVLLGSPVALLFAAPLLLHAVMAFVRRPGARGHHDLLVRHTLDHRSLPEGQGTTCRLVIDGAGDVEQVTRALQQTPQVASRPPSGVVGGLVAAGSTPDLEVAPRRWGRRVLGAESVALTSAWAGYRAGPVQLDGALVRVLAVDAPFRSGAQVPRPVGLVGANRSQQLGSGTEFADIRPFRPGDRLRRISWRVSVRTGELHVTTSPAEQDSAVLLVVDALADHGRSEGVGGAASSLDLTVRAASTLAGHHVAAGDRVGLRVVGGDGGVVGYGSGARHLWVLRDTLAGLRPGGLPEGIAGRIQLAVTGGSLVLVLSPMLDPAIVTAAASLTRRGLSVIVVDTLPPDARPDIPEGVDPALGDLAWRMRRLEREQILSALTALGCPAVTWRGPGTVDEVLVRLSRHGRARPGRSA